jgi:hypothetical protein
MPRCRKYWPFVLCGVGLLVSCDNFDKENAALEIRERFCDEWPYGCTDSTRVELGEVRKTRSGRQVEFRVIDRQDRTATLSAAYFEPRDDDWAFLLFEPPFSERFRAQASRVSDESRRFTDLLMELKSAQRWFVTIYGRNARSLAELDSVSYKPPDVPIQMTVAGGSWRAEIVSPYVRCELDASRQQLPSCAGRPAENAGSESGPLATAFGEGS